jgi:predicted GNAT family acetyltransferase
MAVAACDQSAAPAIEEIVPAQRNRGMAAAGTAEMRLRILQSNNAAWRSGGRRLGRSITAR